MTPRTFRVLFACAVLGFWAAVFAGLWGLL
jgi:hypothetical protein